LFLYVGYFEKRRVTGWIYAFYAMLGWGLLLKGPVAVIIPALTVLGMMVYMRDWKLIWKLRPLTGGLLMLAVALPWYAIENWRTNGAFFDEFIVNQNLRRFTGIGSTYRDGERMPLWYYIPKFLAGTAPWCAVAIVGGIAAIPRLYRHKLREETVFLLMWLVTAFVFFSLSSLKRGDYLLPIYPAAACLVGAVIDRNIDRLPALGRVWCWVWGGIGVVLGILLSLNICGFFDFFGKLIVDDKIEVFSKRDGMSMIMISEFVNAHLVLTVLIAVAAMGILWVAGRLLEKRRAEAAFAMLVVIIFGIFMLYHAAVEPGTDRLKTVKSFTAEVRRIVPAEARLDYCGDYNTEFIFFVDRKLVRNYAEVGDYVVTSPEVARRMRGDAPGVWRVGAQAVEDHQYPAVLLVRNPRLN